MLTHSLPAIPSENSPSYCLLTLSEITACNVYITQSAQHTWP